jgi:hypothetical protein
MAQRNWRAEGTESSPIEGLAVLDGIAITPYVSSSLLLGSWNAGSLTLAGRSS